MNAAFWIGTVQAAGVCHFVTLGLAHATPIPRDWDENLARLSHVHRRFAIAQNVAIGAVIGFAGTVSVLLADELVAGSAAARAICLGISLWWGGRLVILPWLRIWSELRSRLLRAGFVALHVECLLFALGYGWLAFR